MKPKTSSFPRRRPPREGSLGKSFGNYEFAGYFIRPHVFRGFRFTPQTSEGSKPVTKVELYLKKDEQMTWSLWVRCKCALTIIRGQSQQSVPFRKSQEFGRRKPQSPNCLSVVVPYDDTELDRVSEFYGQYFTASKTAKLPEKSATLLEPPTEGSRALKVDVRKTGIRVELNCTLSICPNFSDFKIREESRISVVPPQRSAAGPTAAGLQQAPSPRRTRLWRRVMATLTSNPTWSREKASTYKRIPFPDILQFS